MPIRQLLNSAPVQASMGNKPSTIADHPLHDAKKNRWYEYLRKIESGVGSVNDAAPAVSVAEHT
jgi:hypothetical protein